MNVCGIWPFAQISDDFYYLGIWQCARYFVAALFKELALITIRETWGLEFRSRSRTSRSRSRSRIQSRSRRLRSRLHHWWFTVRIQSKFNKICYSPDPVQPKSSPMLISGASCSKILNDKKYFNTVKIFRANFVFQGKRKLLKNLEW